MTETHKISVVSNLTQADANGILQKCVDSVTSESVIYECLMEIVRNFKEKLLRNEEKTSLQADLDVAKRISSILRKTARKEKSIKYYYFGMYEAELDRIQEQLLKQQSLLKQQEVMNRKHFSSIMQTLYLQKVMRQSDLSKQLRIEKGNLSREMDRLVLAGFVEEKKSGKLKLYSLSAQGYMFYNEYLETQSKLEPERQQKVASRAISEIYLTAVAIDYQEKYDYFLPQKCNDSVSYDFYIENLCSNSFDKGNDFDEIFYDLVEVE